MKKYQVVTSVSVLAIVAMLLLTVSVRENKADQARIAATPEIKAFEVRSSEWGRHYPRQYSTYMQTKKSDAFIDVLGDLEPGLVINWAGYAFSKDYSRPRGHYYMLEDQAVTLRTGAPDPAKGIPSPQPTACWTCKGPDVSRLIARDGELEFFTGTWDKYGSEVVNPVGCADCHDPKTMKLVTTRPHLKRAVDASGILKYDEATQQDMRSLVCAQCHIEYYFKPTEWTDKNGEKKVAKVNTLPWDKGLSVEAIEQYYDEIGFTDYTHKLSKAPILKAQHPDYELFRTSIHFKRGLACADCHMPYVREGGVKYTSHQILGNPLDSIGNTCLNCHHDSEEGFRAIIKRKLERKYELAKQATVSIATAHLEAQKAWELGASEEEMRPALMDIRKGQWRWDFALASHGSFFHAPEEMLRIVADATHYGQEARIKLRAILAKYGAGDYVAPDFSTKEKAQALAGIDLLKESREKTRFLNTVRKEWFNEAKKKGVFDPQGEQDMIPFISAWPVPAEDGSTEKAPMETKAAGEQTPDRQATEKL
ncbi:ammonia-forming cytochrome c nitrite reductase [Desulfobulbus oralis]|uniref:nitrite reductase (cytochrome; ammonia-forming) n=1 Tax=Desulfobulbus oralis TaxID=1986146 RepID=A0A2L1GLG0_9BACT|nr:ammonia-forming cytochrome c nitrite reductase [Desulfobulbus oralis]AVD70520.1 ammonia-forming cytochrome c nitrite reductase subunit c552 [Desulfobulbus oralis]